MSGNHLQNSSNGEQNRLPSSLVVSKFTAARGKEIEAMKKALSSSSGTKLAFQKLPKHMRRRAMSHNVKRLPRRLREIHLNQMKKSGLPPKQKRPSRKYRRRPYNLISDYLRRQRNHQWLNTHIWHAKRFHMIEKWGYKLPECPCDRAFKACYRATVNHCLIQDISYYTCVEIKGEYNTIINNFKKITDPNIGLTIAAKCFVKGYREGCTTIFENDESKKAIGSIYFNWKPSKIDNKHILWIWIHAAYYSKTLDTLISSFNLKLDCIKTEYFTPLLYTNDDDSIELQELKLELNRFRLTGPLSNFVLQNCFHVPENSESTMSWVTNYYKDDTQLKAQKDQWKIFKSMSSPTELPPHVIISLTVLDPRFYLPKKRTKALPNITKTSVYTNMLPENCSDGAIWDSAVRNIVKESRISNAQLSELRKNLLVPGSDLEEKAVPIPILLIQRPGKKIPQNLGYGSGWDIIVPSDCSQLVWMSLIMWGARPGGLRETNSIAFHMDQDILCPDTLGGFNEENFISNKCKELFFKLPPNKRINYSKFKIVSPFNWNWKLLLSEWEDDNSVKDFHVLRDKNILRDLQELLTTKSKHEIPHYSHNCLIPVSIKLSDKGLCKKFAIICLPHEEDLRKCPVEPTCLDKNENLRKEMRKNHKMLLKKLRRRRIREKKFGKVTLIDMDILKSYTTAMRKLWLPDTTTIRNSCSREVIGFVKHGDFSLLLGQSKAIGYITFGSLSSLLSLKCRSNVLIRNTNSKQYRLGRLEIINV